MTNKSYYKYNQEYELCSGILFLTSQGKGLFLKRSNHGDYAGLWGLPGGHLRPSENHEQAARRESKEELGNIPKGKLLKVNRQLSKVEGNDHEESRYVDYTTFIQEIEYEFFPELNKEHEEFVWAPLNEAPQPLHPGLVITLEKMSADELGIAKLISQGKITSPQKYGNITLFDMRITGTGASYRSGIDEFVWRDGSIYLNDEFLQRCNGLPVIFEHPNSSTLNTNEYVDRNVGSIFLPYIKNDEVWGVAKIYDDFAAEIMENNQLSTSPAVVLYGDDQRIELDNGKHILVEGKPRLLDHVAICHAGVWDKQRPPSGVSTATVGDLIMADDDKAAAIEAARKADAEAKAKVDAEAKADAALNAKIDSVMAIKDAMMAFKDAFEEKEKEREKAKADRKARKDAKKARKDMAKADREKADAQAKADAEAKAKADAEAKAKADAEAEEKKRADALEEVRKSVADFASKIPRQMTDADYAAISDSQVRADRIYSMHGKRAPRPLDGETLINYRRRLASDLKEHSSQWKVIDLKVITDEAAFTNIENTIYADAEHAGLHPVVDDDNFLREIVTEDATGRKISTFVGHPHAWMSQFAAPKRKLVGIRNHS